MRILRNIVILAVVLASIYAAANMYWHNEQKGYVDHKAGDTQISCVVNSPDKKVVNLNSFGNPMQATYVESGAEGCITQKYPIVIFESTGKTKPNAWFQVIHSKNIPYFKGKPYVDSLKELKGIYPFYKLEADFSDAPSSNYGIVRLETFDWVAHAYGVVLDKDGTISSVVGGIRWGYMIEPLALFPKTIVPTALGKEQYDKDLAIFRKVLQEVKAAGNAPLPSS